MLMTACPLYFEFFRHMKYILVPFFPVDVLEGVALLVALYGLLQGFAQGEQVVDMLIGAYQSLLQGHLFQRMDASLDIAVAVWVCLSLVLNAVEGSQLLFQDFLQNYIGRLATPQPQCLLRCEVGIAQVLQEEQSRDLGDVVFFEAGCGHGVATFGGS